MRLENTAQVKLAYVRPGPNAFTWLASAIHDLKGGDPFRPVSVVVPNDYAGRMVHWHLGRHGGYVNVRTLRLSQAVAEVAQATRGPRHGVLNPVLEESAVRAALRQHRDRFDGVEHRSLHRALVELFRELRRSAPDPARLTGSARSRAAQAALGAYRDFQDRTRDYDDPTRRADRAARHLSGAGSIPDALARLGALVIFLPTRLDPHDVRFLAAAARWVPLWAALVEVSDPQGLGDEPGREAAEHLASALGVAPPEPGPTTGRVCPFADVRVVRAPDPAEEVREVVRGIAADLEQGVPLHRTAILYRQDEPYAALVRDALDAAGLPWASSEGRRLNASRHGRCLLSLLRLPERRFTREAVMEWLETGPILDESVAAIPPASWNRLSRAANVVRGTAQWTERLERHAAALEQEILDRERDGASPAALDSRRRRAASARTMAIFVKDLGQALRAPPGAARWTEYVDWARELRDRFAGSPDHWPEGEREFATAVDAVLEGLGDADRIEAATGPSPAEFVAALEAALDANRRPTGQPGRGILVEPLGAVIGLAFERAYVLGMREGAFPPSPAVDPFFPVGTDDPLDRRSRQHARERQDFLVSLACTDGGVVTLCVPDSDGTRPTFPARWLLEVGGQRAGKDLDATDFAALDGATHPWLRVVRSAQHAVSRDVCPADIEDRRLQQAARWTRLGRPLDQHALARRPDLPLGPALELAGERRSFAFSRFDGNVSALAGSARRLLSIFDGRRAVSASAVQTWATCGFRYFLERVIGVEPTERPEENWTIDPLDRGSLVHAVLEAFYTQLQQHGRPGPDERYAAADAALIEHLAREQFAGYRNRGVTGHPLAWENAQSVILADLRAFLAADEEWRLEQRLVPTRFEQGFGFTTSGSWPALAVGAPTRSRARSIRFRGYIDRIDLDPAADRAYVFDYKTGTGAGYAALARDPVAAGQHVQLALYSRAVRENLPAVTRVGGAFWFATAKGQFKRLELDDDTAAVDHRLDDALEVISRGIEGGAFPQVPGDAGDHGFANCCYCDFDRVCPARRDLSWRRKQNDPLAAIHLRLALPSESSGESGLGSDE